MPRFSKAQYVAVAQVIDAVAMQRWVAIANATSREESAVTIAELTTAFADMFEQDNPRFDRQRFVSACEGDAQDLWGLSA